MAKSKMSESLLRIRHSCAHVMADAVRQTFGDGVKLGVGPAIEEGFYYDFLTDRPFTEEDLLHIEARMKKIMKRNHPFELRESSYEEAKAILEERGERLKLELLEDFKDETITFYRHGDFSDLCEGPHVERTGELKAFKLLKVAGAYWRGDEKRDALQRIYGTAFETKEEIEAHLARLEEAAKRDHRKLGKELDLFSIHHDQAGAGLVYWHPKGAVVRDAIEGMLKEKLRELGYKMVYTPHIVRADLWKTSGHYQMDYPMFFTEVEGDEYGIKPMNCPGHILIYKSRTRSHRDLPLRIGEMGTVYRFERSGVLHGLLRVRGFTQDDAHLFCAPEQLKAEIVGTLKLAQYVFGIFGFEYEAEISTRPEKSVGSDENWEKAEAALREALGEMGVSFETDEGGGAFYGPKIDMKVRDAIGRQWQLGTIQVDFNLPERFEMEYAGEDGGRHRPVMVHRAVFGSFERFFGILIEHFAGAFPLWCAPEQVRALPITSRTLETAQKAVQTLREAGFRAEADERNEKLGAKIRHAQLEKVPYMLVIGDREAEEGKVAVRSLKGGDLGTMTLDEFAAGARGEIDGRRLESLLVAPGNGS